MKEEKLKNKSNRFLNLYIWRYDNQHQSKCASLLKKAAGVIFLSIKDFFGHKCMVQAGALTFYTLISIVPLFAIAFALARGFGLDSVFEREVCKLFVNQQEVANTVMSFAKNLLSRTSSTGIAGVGAIVVLWSVIRLFSNIENSFNEVWGIKKARNLWRKFTDYTAMCIVLVMLLILTTGATVYINLVILKSLDVLDLADRAEHIVLVASWVTPFLLSSLLFTFFYAFIPNTKVNFLSALFAGIIAGSLFYGVQLLLLTAGASIMKANPIYGSLAALPLFLFWLNLSWMFLLYGCELSHACQNIREHAFKGDCCHLSRRFRDLVSIMLVREVALAMYEQRTCPNDQKLALLLDLPVRLINEQLTRLEEVGLLIQAIDPKTTRLIWVPNRDLASLTPRAIVQSLHTFGEESLPMFCPEANARIRRSLDDFDFSKNNAKADLPVTSI